MHRSNRVTQVAIALALGFSLAGCDSLGDLENLLNTKKPLPGERKPVFADGVPGVPQGVPPELVRGYQAPPETQPTEAAQTPPEQAAKPVQRPKPKPRSVAAPARPPTAVTVQPAVRQPQTSAWPAPASGGDSQSQAQPPAQQPPQWPPASAQGSAPPAPSPWPAAPPAGTFSR